MPSLVFLDKAAFLWWSPVVGLWGDGCPRPFPGGLSYLGRAHSGFSGPGLFPASSTRLVRGRHWEGETFLHSMLLSACCIPGSVVNAQNMLVKKTGKTPAFLELVLQAGERQTISHNKEVHYIIG